jgi:hypothetical protein
VGAMRPLGICKISKTNTTGIGLECEQQATDTVVQWESLVLARSPACQIKGSQGALSSLVAGCHISKEGGRVVVVGGVKLGLSQPHCLAAHLESER